MNRPDGIYQEQIGYSRGSLWAPFHAVGMVARLRGDLPAEVVEAALRKLKVLYPPLACRVRLEKDGSGWLTREGVGDLAVEERQGAADDDWTGLFLEQERIPFAFDRGPLARFFLLRGDGRSDLVAIVPHVICDGPAMVDVMTDAAELLNDPNRKVASPHPPPPASWKTMAHAATDNLLLRGAIGVANRLWPGKREGMGQEEYEEVHRVYWATRKNGLLAFVLEPDETAGLLARCRQRGLSVSGALLAACLLAEAAGRPDRRTTLGNVTVAVNMRSRMLVPPGRAVGIYASNISLAIRPRPGTDFWELAGECHGRLHQALGHRSQILWPLAVGEIKPAISDSLLAALSTGELRRRLGPLSRLVKIGGMNPGLDVSNIGRVELPCARAPIGLETMLPLPPLWPGGGIALNVLTVDGQMNLILKYRLDQNNDAGVAGIRDRALQYLAESS
ncbi:MAG TPA: hypothetical protein PKO09_06190 [Anaerolineae bacterium]|nr:hypothetical protein [Anaerolineae bacterium]